MSTVPTPSGDASGRMNLCHVSIQGAATAPRCLPAARLSTPWSDNPALTGDSGKLGQIRAVIEGVTQTDSGCAEHPPIIDYPVIHRVLDPVNLPLDHETVTALKARVPDRAWWRAGTGMSLGPCDANIMAGEGETTIIFGPGDLAYGAHGTSEFVPVEQVVDACAVYAHLIIDWCGVSTSLRSSMLP